jgi:hypothetical protein
MSIQYEESRWMLAKGGSVQSGSYYIGNGIDMSKKHSAISCREMPLFFNSTF